MTRAEGLYSNLVSNCVFNAFLSCTAIVLNIITIQALRKTLSLPKPLKALLLSLAVSDLGVGLFVQPVYVAVLVMEIQENTDSATNSVVETVFPVQNIVLAFASFFSVVALTVDRFLAIHLHLRYQELVTHKRVVAVVILSWVLSAFFPILSVYWYQVFCIVAATTRAVCFITTGLIYYKIFAAVRRHANQIHVLQVQQEAQNGEMANAARLRKTAVATLYVYVVFLACYLPLFIFDIADIFSGDSNLLLPLLKYALTLQFLNSSLNPLIYCWKMRHIRQTILEILRNNFPSRQ